MSAANMSAASKASQQLIACIIVEASSRTKGDCDGRASREAGAAAHLHLKRSKKDEGAYTRARARARAGSV